MKIPEFTAEASLYQTSNKCRSLPFDRTSPKTNVVIPQLGGKGFKGFQGCVSDCLDQNPNLTRHQCEGRCKDPFAGVDLGTSRSWFDSFLTNIGIDFWEAGCTGITGAPVPCGWLADVIRRQS